MADQKPLKIFGFNHTALTVSDLDATIAFFVEGLGFEQLSRGPREPALISRMTSIPGVQLEISYLQGPGHRIELISYSAPADKKTVIPRFCDNGATHIALDVDNMDLAVEIAARYGYTLAGEVIAIDAGPNKGRRVAYVRDHEGITVEFLEMKA